MGTNLQCWFLCEKGLLQTELSQHNVKWTKGVRKIFDVGFHQSQDVYSHYLLAIHLRSTCCITRNLILGLHESTINTSV